MLASAKNSGNDDQETQLASSDRHLGRQVRRGLTGRWGVALLLLAGTSLGGIFGGLLGAKSVALEAVIYSWQESQAELFFASEFGTFADHPSSQQFVDMGSNRIRFPLDEAFQQDSFTQRLDPCDCPWGLSIGRIGLSSPFGYQSKPATNWGLDGSATDRIPDSNMFLLQNTLPETDPQILLYFDVASFIERSTILGALTGGALGLLAVGLGLWFYSRCSALNSLISVDVGLQSRRPAFSKLPPWVMALVVSVLALGVWQTLWGAYTTGVTIDEGYHLGHLQSYLAGGSYSSASYGPLASLFGHGLNSLLGVEAWGSPLGTPGAFAGRHLAMGLLGVMAMAAVGLSSGILLRSWSWGFVGAALLASIPVWVGHSMFNIKDVPAGAGYALFSAGLVVALASFLRLRLRIPLAFTLLALGTLVTIGTRPGMWPLLAASAFATVVVWAISLFMQRTSLGLRRQRWLLSGGLGLLVVIAAVALSVLFFTEFGRELAEAVTRSLDHPWSKSRRYAGIRVFNRPDALFVFQILLSQLPTFIAALFLLGAVIAAVAFVRAVIRGSRMGMLAKAFPVFAIQVFVPFLVLAVFSPVLYDGIRQILFVVPGVAVFAAIGLWGVVRAVSVLFESRRRIKAVVGAGICIAFVLISVDQIRLFPYNYVYYNEIAQGSGIGGAWETDYWDSSFREAIDGAVVAEDPIMCGFTHTTYWNIEDLRAPCITISPYLDELTPGNDSILAEREFWTVRSERNLLQYGPPPFNCFPESAVTRKLRSETLVMSRLYRCIDY
jgi:hypothetical protein